MFNAPTALAAYAQAFDEAGRLDQLAGFLSLHGAAFYGLPPAPDTITLERAPWTPPEVVALPQGGHVRVFLGGEVLPWRVTGVS